MNKGSDPKSLAGRPAEKSKLLGQVFTPASIASEMVDQLLGDRRNQDAGMPAKILDPCVGPFTFPLAAAERGLLSVRDELTVVDLDEEMVACSAELGRSQEIDLNATVADYLDLPMDDVYDYAVLNPPYIRQEWIDKKTHYRGSFKHRYKVAVPGTSNLYVYFLVKVLMDLRPGGRFSCIVYDSWQSTRYGRWLSDFLFSRCESLRVDTKRDQPFHTRLIDATVIHGVKKVDQEEGARGLWSATSLPKRSTSTEELSRSGRIKQEILGTALDANLVPSPVSGMTAVPSGPLSGVQGFFPLGEIFPLNRRGLRLKQADFFLFDLLEGSDSLVELATPFLKKIGRVKGFRVPDDYPGAALLLASAEFADADGALVAELERRLEAAKRSPERNVSILTWHRDRPESWHLHREAPYAPIVFNYYLRNRPRHIFNPRHAYSDNFYGLPVENGIPPLAWLAALNTTAVSAEVMARSRNQGDGLAKIQLFEYREVNVPDLTACSKAQRTAFESIGSDMIERPRLAAEAVSRADDLLAAVFSDPRLSPDRVAEMFEECDLRARRPKEASFSSEGLV